MSFSLDGRMCAVATDYFIYVYDTRSGELLSELSNANRIVAFNQNNNLMLSSYYAGDGGYSTDVIDVASGDVLYKIDGLNKGMHQNPSNNEVAILSTNNSDDILIRICDSKTGGSLKSIPFDSSFGQLYDMAYSPNGKYFAVSSYDNPKTIIFDAVNNYSKLTELSSRGSLSFNKDGDILVVGDKVYNSSDNFKEFYTIKEKGYSEDINVEYTLLTPDSKYFIHYGGYDVMIVGGYDVEVRILDATNILVTLKELRLEPSSIELIAGETIDLKLVGVYSNGATENLDLQKAKCVVSDFSVAKIEGETKLTGLSTGTTNLDITYNGITLKKEVNVVSKKLKELRLEYDDTPIMVGATKDLKLIGVYADGTTEYLDLQKANYTVDNSSIAKIDEKSKLHGVAAGTTSINISYKDVSLKKDIVIKPPIRITLQINNKYMYSNGEMKDIDHGKDTKPIIRGGRTLLPIRAVIEELGGSVDWIGEERKIIIKLKDKSIEMWLDNNTAYVNDIAEVMDVAPALINARTMMPLRFVVENLGISLEWDGNTQMIYIF